MTRPDRSSSSSTRATSRRLVAALAIAALLIASFTPAGVASADTPLLDLDENTPLTKESTWSTYEQDDVATADVAAPDLEITIAREHEDVDVDGFHNDYAYEWIRVEYGEDIDRKIRFYVPSNYWKPYYDESVDPVAGDQVTAKFVPVDGGRYTAVTITFTGPTDVVFPASQVRGDTWAFWSSQDKKIENATGFSSGVAGTEQWTYARSSDWSNGTLVVSNVSNPDRVSIQYDADISSEKEVWLRVPDGESRRAPVYYMTRDGGENASSTIVVVSKEQDPPAIRMKKNANPRDGIGSILNDWKQIDDRIGDLWGSLFGSSEK